MIYIGDKEIKSVYKGSTPIIKIYKGDNLVHNTIYVPRDSVGESNSYNYAYLDDMQIFNKDVRFTLAANRTGSITANNEEINPIVILTSSYKNVHSTGTNTADFGYTTNNIAYPMGVINYGSTTVSNYRNTLFNEVNPDNAYAVGDNNNIIIKQGDVIYPSLLKLIFLALTENSSSGNSIPLADLSYQNTQDFTLILYTTSIANNENSYRVASDVMFEFKLLETQQKSPSNSLPYSVYKINYKQNPNANSVGV